VLVPAVIVVLVVAPVTVRLAVSWPKLVTFSVPVSVFEVVVVLDVGLTVIVATPVSETVPVMVEATAARDVEVPVIFPLESMDRVVVPMVPSVE
jgi:hypothetical protein